MDIPILATDRLRLRPVEPEADAASLHAGFGDAETLRYWHRPPRRSPDDTRSMLAEMVARPSSCEWALCERGRDRAIGQLGFGAPDGRGRASFGYLLLPEFWGRGYASEAGRAAFEHGFVERRLGAAELWIYEGNARSVRVAEKLGCRLRGQFMGQNLERGFAARTLVYGLTAREWGVDPPPEEPVPVYAVHPVIASGDVQAAVDFWCGKLGFRLDWVYGDPPTAAAVTRSEWSMQATVRFERVTRLPRERSGRLVFAVSDVDALHTELRGRGVAIESPPETRPWGFRELDLIDCHGESLRFYGPASPPGPGEG